MARSDFVNAYNLSEAREKLSRDLISNTNDLGKIIDSAMGFRTRTVNCEVGKNDGLYKIRFSSDSYLERYHNSFVLAPFETRRFLKKLSGVVVLRKFSRKFRNPFISLAYSLEEKQGDFSVTINYIQSTNRMKRDVYDSLKSELGANPHEFLLAHFISRLSPVLNASPNTEVKINLNKTHKPVYPKLRDRFFDKKYALNPKKERVIQILGEDNLWLREKSVQERSHAQ